jgi:hypothetical protein
VQLQKTLEIEPNFWFAHAYLGRTYRKLGRLPEAVAELQKAGQLSGGTVETFSGLALPTLHKEKKLKRERFFRNGRHRPNPRFPRRILPRSLPVSAKRTKPSHICRRPMKKLEEGVKEPAW